MQGRLGETYYQSSRRAIMTPRELPLISFGLLMEVLVGMQDDENHGLVRLAT